MHSEAYSNFAMVFWHTIPGKCILHPLMILSNLSPLYNLKSTSVACVLSPTILMSYSIRLFLNILEWQPTCPMRSLSS